VYRLNRIIASLRDYYCYYPSTPSRLVLLSVALDLAANLTAEFPWCPSSVPWYSEVKFIVSLAVIGTLVVLFLIAVGLVYRRRKTEKVQWYISLALGFLGRHPPSPASSATSSEMNADISTTAPSAQLHHPVDCDAFVYWHDDDLEWTRRVIIDALLRRSYSIVTALDFEIGSPKIDELLKSIERSRVVICVLTDGFIADGWCREALLRAYTSRPQAVLPVVPGTSVNHGEDDVLLKNIVRTNCPLYFDQDEGGNSLRQFQDELCLRIDFIIDTSGVKTRYKRVFSDRF